jgi:hypothetical protein
MASLSWKWLITVKSDLNVSVSSGDTSYESHKTKEKIRKKKVVNEVYSDNNFILL